MPRAVTVTHDWWSKISLSLSFEGIRKKKGRKGKKRRLFIEAIKRRRNDNFILSPIPGVDQSFHENSIQKMFVCTRLLLKSFKAAKWKEWRVEWTRGNSLEVSRWRIEIDIKLKEEKNETELGKVLIISIFQYEYLKSINCISNNFNKYQN